MKKAPLLLSAIAILCVSFSSFAQTKTGQICFIRSTGLTGSLVNDKVFIDNKLVCKLKNKQYSMHTVAIGDHTVAVDATGVSLQKRSAPFTVHVEAEKITYIDLVLANQVSVVEITKGSADVKMKKLKQNTNCSTAK